MVQANSALQCIQTSNALQCVQTSSAVKCRHPSQQCTAVQGIQTTKLAIKPWERPLACQAASFHPPCLMTQWPVGRQTFPSLRPAAQTLAGRDKGQPCWHIAFHGIFHECPRVRESARSTSTVVTRKSKQPSQAIFREHTCCIIQCQSYMLHLL